MNTQNGKRATQNRLDSFDILSLASNEISLLAHDCDVDWQALLRLIETRQTTTYTDRKATRFALSKRSNGKVWASVQFKTARSGQEYVDITFKTFKHGGITETFKGYQWLKDNGYLGNKESHAPRSAATPKAEQPKLKPVKTCKSCKQPFSPKYDSFQICPDCYTFNYKLKVFNDTQKQFDNLPIAENSPYFERKGLNLSEIQHGLTIKRGFDEKGGYVIYPLQTIDGKIVGFQKIYDDKVLNDGTNDKNYCYLPIRDDKNKVTTLKTSSFAIAGKIQSKNDLIYCCEGLATGLSGLVANGSPIIVCLDTSGIEAIPRLFFNRGYDNLTIAADNDLKPNDTSNSGLFSALKAVRFTNIKIVYPELDDKKCDFDDLRQAKGIEAVAEQLDYKRSEFDHVRPEFLKDSFHYHLQLIKYAPEQQLKSVIGRACCYVGRNKIATISEFKNAYHRLRKAVKARDFDNGAYVRQLIKKYFNRKLALIKTENAITDFSGVECHDFTGKTNTDIAKLITSLNKAIFLDTRSMGGDKNILDSGKTNLMRVIADYWLNRELQQATSFDAVKYHHFTNGGNESEWQQIRNNPKLFKSIQDSLKPATRQQSRENKKPVYVCHRVSLTSSGSERLGLEYYDDVKPGQHFDSMATVVNSMLKHEISQTVKVLFIDEARQTLEHVLNGTCENRLEVFNELIAAIQAADIVIMADADFNQFTLDWLKGIANKPLHAITQKPAKTEKIIYQLGNHNATLQHAKKSLKSSLNVWISTDSMQQARKADLWLNSPNVLDKDSIEGIVAELTNGTGLTEDDVLIIHSENKGDIKQALFLANPNEESKKYRLVIHTPVISSGVSVTNTHFQRVYAMFSNVLAPNEMLQTIARVRTATEIFISFKGNHAKDRSTDLKDLIEGQIIKVGRFNTEKFVTEYDDFDRLRLQQIATRNAALNDYMSYFKILSQLKGYRFEVLDMTKHKIDGLSKAAKEQKIVQVLMAEIIDIETAAALDSKTNLTQQESDNLHRYNVSQLTGKAHEVIDDVDIDFYLNKGLSILSNFELVKGDVIKLKEQDQANQKTRDKLASKASKHYIFKTVVEGLTDKAITKNVACGVCRFLSDNHKELAANNLGNYKSVSKQPVKQLSDFLKKLGYELALIEQKSTGERIYKIQPNPLVKFYAENREAKKKLLDHKVSDFEFID